MSSAVPATLLQLGIIPDRFIDCSYDKSELADVHDNARVVIADGGSTT